MTKAELQRVRDWADEKIATGDEPPWAWYQYMKLRETLDAILAGQAATTRQGDSPQSAGRQGAGPRLAVCNVRQDTAQRRPEDVPVQLPM